MIEHLDGIHETVTYKENSSLRLFVNTDCEDYPIHWHTPMEIIMPLEGTYTVFLGDKPVLLQEGDIIFICPGILHSLVAPENGKRIILQIEWSVVSKIRDLNSILALISPVLTLTPQTAPDIYSDIYHLICQILSEYEEDSFLSEAVIYARMLDILSLSADTRPLHPAVLMPDRKSRKNIWIVFFPSAIILMNTARKIFLLTRLQKQQASANTTLPDCLSSLQIPPITNTLIAKELIMPCCSYPIPIFLSRRQHFSLVSPVFPPFFASSVLSNNVRLRNSAICIFIRKSSRKIPNSCCCR